MKRGCENDFTDELGGELRQNKKRKREEAKAPTSRVDAFVQLVRQFWADGALPVGFAAQEPHEFSEDMSSCEGIEKAYNAEDWSEISFQATMLFTRFWQRQDKLSSRLENPEEAEEVKQMMQNVLDVIDELIPYIVNEAHAKRMDTS